MSPARRTAHPVPTPCGAKSYGPCARSGAKRHTQLMCSSPRGERPYLPPGSARRWRGSARHRPSPSQSTRTCCATPAASSWRTTATTPAPSSTTWDTRTSPTPSATPSWRRGGSAISGRIEAGHATKKPPSGGFFGLMRHTRG